MIRPSMLPRVWRVIPSTASLVVVAACLSTVGGFLSPTAERVYGNIPAKALCLDYDRELLQFLSSYNFTQHTRSPLPELRVCVFFAESQPSLWHLLHGCLHGLPCLACLLCSISKHMEEARPCTRFAA